MVMKLTAMVFMLLMGASTFSLVFRGLLGRPLRGATCLSQVPRRRASAATAVVMAIMFGLAFFLDALEIIFSRWCRSRCRRCCLLGAEPRVWLALAHRDQTCRRAFLHPPFGFAINLPARAWRPRRSRPPNIYWGVIPFILIQLSVFGAGVGLSGDRRRLPRRSIGERRRWAR